MFGLGKHKKEIEVTVVDNREYIIIEGEHYQKANPYKGEDVVLERIIEKLTNIIDRLTAPRQRLSATYIFNGIKFHSKMATITLNGSQDAVSGQLVPLAADNSQQPITAINPGSENYSSSDSNICSVAADSSAEGAFVVTRVSAGGGSATVSYTAKNANGDTISGSDDFVFEAVVTPPVLATSLTATYGTPT
jgi:hypothetical protein